jgi:hypothetical protein
VTLEDLVVGSYRLESDADAPSSRTHDAPPGSLVATLAELIVGMSRSSKTGGDVGARLPSAESPTPAGCPHPEWAAANRRSE